MLNPAFALVSMNMAPCSCALASPSSVDTFLVHPVNIIEKAICGLHTKDQSTKWIFPFWVYIVGRCLWKWNSELILSWWQDSQIQTSCRQGQFYFRQGRMEDEHIGASLCIHFLNPLWRIQKGLPVCKEGWHEAGIAQVEVMSIQTFSPDSFFSKKNNLSWNK